MYAATIGFFDGVHLGHRYLIEQVREAAGQRGLIPLAITFDGHPRKVVQPEFVPQLLTTTAEKLALLREAGLEHVRLLTFDQALSRLTAREFMQQMYGEMGVRALVMGYDHRFGHGGGTPKEYRQWGREAGIEVIAARELEGLKASSSLIRRHLEVGAVAKATALLGYAYRLGGEVVGGHRIGRTIGFPTANLVVEADKLKPAMGVYAVMALLPDGTRRMGMLNIGNRPTMANGEAVSVEVHLLDFEGSLYGRYLTLSLEERLRGERRFASREALVAQLQQDALAVRRLLG